MPSVTLTRIEQLPGGGVRFHFGKHVREWSSVQFARQAAKANLTKEDLIDLALGLVFFRQPNLGNPAQLEGRTITIDFDSNIFGTVT